MSKLLLGLLCGLLFGAVSVATMIPLSFENKQAAMLGAFINRFAIGVVIGAVALPFPGWLTGLLFGLLLSLPDAIITKAYAPIIGTGLVFGAAENAPSQANVSRCARPKFSVWPPPIDRPASARCSRSASTE